MQMIQCTPVKAPLRLYKHTPKDSEFDNVKQIVGSDGLCEYIHAVLLLVD